MRSPGYVLTAAVLALGSATAPAQAASPGSVIVLAGTTSASIEIVLATSTTFDLEGMTARRSGRYNGFYIEAVDRPPEQRAASGGHLGAVTFRDLHGPGESGLTVGFDSRASQTLGPGRYRIYLLADGPTELVLPVRGSSTRRLRPSHVSRLAFAQRTNILKSAIEAENAQPLTLVGTRSVSLSTILVGRFRAYIGDVGACLRLVAAECGSTTRGGDGSYAGYVVSPLADVDLSFTSSYAPGALKPANYEAYQAALNATTLEYASGAALSLSLT